MTKEVLKEQILSNIEGIVDPKTKQKVQDQYRAKMKSKGGQNRESLQNFYVYLRELTIDAD